MNKKISEVLIAALKSAKGEEEIIVVANNSIKAVSDLEGQLDSSFALIDEQALKLEEVKRSNPSYRPTAKINEGTFRINHPIRTEAGLILSITDIAENLKLVADLAKSASTAVTKLTEEEISNS